MRDCPQREINILLQRKREMHIIGITINISVHFTQLISIYFWEKILILGKNYCCLAIHILGAYFVNFLEFEIKFVKIKNIKLRR